MIIVCPHCKRHFVHMRHQTKGTVEQRFNQRVFVAPNGCWIWLGGHTGRGYPQFTRAGQSVYAHRLSWEIHRGPIPKGMDVCHNCPSGDNPLCVNPDHLFLGTHKENMRDMVKKGRRRCWGEKTRTAKLTESQVLEIRKRWPSSDLSERELGIEYNVGQAAISRIILGQTWKHLQSPVPAP